ncbi:hypothetical protein RirG_126480 [Rhizophagus irregularis DAOM 197198w]|uniref:Uncharacterized protein n=1 Tax=Rhizophagus irregularis (strain DAOM 197198w) TaxID=1432141 RepID=A0A015MH59_RHIIW|nr:hypothetical protein RirG_126480 [Rhizophagus irregularis DAOM 197198w]
MLKAQAEELTKNFQDYDYDDGYVEPDVGDDPDAPKWTWEDDQHVIDLIMGYETSKRLPKRLQKAKNRRDDWKLAQAMRNLDLNDDAMDIDTNTASFDDLKIIPDEEGGFVLFEVQKKSRFSSPGAPLRSKVTPVKIPAKITAKSVPAKAEEILSARKVTEISEDLAEEEQEENIREDDPMNIDIACLENTKDLSFNTRKAAEKLGLDIDKSITYNISGTPETGRTFSMVKGVSIKLITDCIITEDLAVLNDYKHK